TTLLIGALFPGMPAHSVDSFLGSSALSRVVGNPMMVYERMDDHAVKLTMIDPVNGNRFDLMTLKTSLSGSGYVSCATSQIGLLCGFESRLFVIDGRISDPRVIYVSPVPTRLDRSLASVQPFVTTSGGLYVYETYYDNATYITASWRLLR